MVRGVIDRARSRIDEPFRSAACVVVIDVAFLVRVCGQKFFAVRERVTADHHAESCPRIEISLGKRVAVCFVKRLRFAFGPVVGGKLGEFAKVSCDGITSGICA